MSILKRRRKTVTRTAAQPTDRLGAMVSTDGALAVARAVLALDTDRARAIIDDCCADTLQALEAAAEKMGYSDDWAEIAGSDDDEAASDERTADVFARVASLGIDGKARRVRHAPEAFPLRYLRPGSPLLAEKLKAGETLPDGVKWAVYRGITANGKGTYSLIYVGGDNPTPTGRGMALTLSAASHFERYAEAYSAACDWIRCELPDAGERDHVRESADD